METYVDFAIRTAVFALALAFAAARFRDVTIRPRAAIPLVALVFALLNAFVYGLLAFTVNLVTLFTLFLIVPFVVNALLLVVTDRLLKPFAIDSLSALGKTAGLLTLCHLGLRLFEI